MSKEGKLPKELTRANIGSVVSVDTWTEFEKGVIEEKSEKSYVGRLVSFATHHNGIVINLESFTGIVIRHGEGDKVAIQL